MEEKESLETRPNADKDEETGSLTHCWQECKTVQPLWKNLRISQVGAKVTAGLKG